MTAEVEEHAAQPVGMTSLWFGLLGAKIAWLAHLALSYPLVPWVCANGGTLLLHLITVATLGVAAVAGWVSWRSARQLEQALPTVDRRGLARSQFMAHYSVFSSGLFAIAIIAQGVPVFVINPCA